MYDRLSRTIRNALNPQGIGTYDPAHPDQNVRAAFAYDTLGELTTACQPQAEYLGCDETSSSDTRAWHYAYDAWGNLDVQTPPVNQTLTHLSVRDSSYDSGNRMTSVCDRPDTSSSCSSSTRKTDLTYDKLGRVTETKAFLPTATLKLDTIATFDATGARTQLQRKDGTGSVIDTLTFIYDDLSGRETAVKRSSTTLTGLTWNADGTLASRTDDGITGSSGFSYDRLDRLTSMTSPLYTGSAAFGWRADGLLASRGWPSGNTASVAYDAMKRPTSLTENHSGSQQAQFTQVFDRNGNITTEGRILSGISGSAGSGDQTFSYDAVHRVTGATLASATQTYAYDADGNRTGVTRAGTTTAYAYDRADALMTKTVGGGSPTSFVYDTYGNLTTSQVSSSGCHDLRGTRP
jgi:YD repeat-containing protein